MMFFINKVSHEVHKSICEHMMNPNIVMLGSFEYPEAAINAAINKGYYDANYCYYCCPKSKKR